MITYVMIRYKCAPNFIGRFLITVVLPQVFAISLAVAGIIIVHLNCGKTFLEQY